MKKPKFNKKKCLECIYHGSGSCGYLIENNKGKTVHVHCNYSAATERTCLQRGKKGTTIDLRGEDYNNCRLFVKGEAINDDIAAEV